jgi:hypothetical protein
MAITSINLGKIKFNWKGAWSLGVTYVKDDVVRYSGSSYVCTTGHTSATSWATNSSKWDLMTQGLSPTTTAGDIIYNNGSADTRLGIGSSGQVLTVSTGGVPVWADNGVLNKIYYVAPSGNDSNSGLSWGTAFATIKHACSVAVGPATIRVASGSYQEQLPITVPSFVAVIGDNQRTTIVGPASGYEQQTMWKLGDGALLNKMAFVGLTGYVPYAPNDQNIELATIGGVYVAFDPLTPITTKSPYVIECSAKSAGGVGALVDGSVHSTGIKSMVFHGFTVILDGGVGYWVSSNGKAEIVSCFTYYCHMGYVTTGGGKIRALNGNNSYGTYGALSSGYNSGELTVNGTVYGNMLTYTGGSLVSSFTDGETITGGTSGATGTVLNSQSGTNRVYYKSTNGFTFQAGETVTGSTSGATMVIATGGVTGQKGVILIVTGLSAAPKAGGSIEINGDSIPYVIQSQSGWTNSGSHVIVVLATDKTAESTDGTSMKIRYDYSNIRLTGHDFLNIGTGGVASTNYPGTPTQAPDQGNEVIELFPGRVFYVSTDQDGNFRVGEYFKVDQATGRATLNASAFDLSGLTSLKLGSIGAQLGAQINEFSTDTTLSGNSDLAVPTEKAVRTYFGQIATNVAPSISNSLTLGTSSYLWDKVYANKLVGPSTLIIDPATEGDNTGTLEIKGNLQVDGATTTLSSDTINVGSSTSSGVVAFKSTKSAVSYTNAAATFAGGVGIAGDLYVNGNYYINGEFNQISSTVLNINDQYLYLNDANPADLTDSGVVIAYNPGAGHRHTGLIRVASSGTYRLFKGATNEPTSSTFDFTGATDADLQVGNLTSALTSINVFNATPTTVNAFGAATTIGVGATSGTLTLNNPTVVGTQTTVNLWNTTSTTVNAFGAATTIGIGAATGTLTVNNATLAVKAITSTGISINTGSSASALQTIKTTATTGTAILTLDANTTAGSSNVTGVYFASSGTNKWAMGGGNVGSAGNNDFGLYNYNTSTTTMTINTSTNLVTLSNSLTIGGTLTENSSIVYKENVNPITNALDAVMQLVGVTYDRKDGSRKDEAGLIAEDVDKILPNLVTHKEDGSADGIQYTKLTAYLLEAIKTLKTEIDELKGSK